MALSTTTTTTITMNTSKTIKAIFIPDAVMAPTTAYIAVVPCTATIMDGETKNFRAYLHKSDGSSPEITSSSVWSVSNASIATLGSSKGEVKGKSPGQVVVTASHQGLSGTADLTVKGYEPPPPPNYDPKANWYGRTVVIIDKFYPSSKLCHVCGEINPMLTLSIREWQCPKCRTVHDRDGNAAQNILNEGLRLLTA